MSRRVTMPTTFSFSTTKARVSWKRLSRRIAYLMFICVVTVRTGLDMIS